MARILVVESVYAAPPSISACLSTTGIEMRVETRALPALSLGRVWRPSVLVFDLDCAGLRLGLDVCRLVRSAVEFSRTAVVVVSRETDEAAELALFDAGADDYVRRHRIARPSFSARIAAILRRVCPGAPCDTLRLGSLLLDRARREALVGDARLELTATEFEILWRLVAASGRCLPRAELIQGLLHVVPASASRAVDMHIGQLRRKLGAEAGLIHTHYGVGYSLRSATPMEADEATFARAG